MKTRYIFHNDHYYHTLKNQVGNGIPVFHGVRQRGGGIGSVLGGIAKYALPLVMKYIFPHAKTAANSVISDVVGNRSSLKGSVKKSGLQFLKNVGNSILEQQSGKGITNRGKKRKLISDSFSIDPKRKRKSSGTKVVRKKKTKAKKKLGNKKLKTKLDIFN